MAALGGDCVVSAVAKNVRSQFSKEDLKELYKELPQQGVQKPYAFIHQINAEHQNQMRNSANWTFMLDIRVHPKDHETDIQSWARGVAFKLIEAVNIITVSGQSVKARKTEYSVQDNVLHFIVSYEFRVIHAESEVPDMENLLYGGHLKQ